MNSNKQMPTLSKKKLICFAFTIATCWFGFQLFFAGDFDKKLLKKKRSAEDIIHDIDAELKIIFSTSNEEKSKKHIVDYETISKRKQHILANPDNKLHHIKRQEEIVFNKTGLTKYIDILKGEDTPTKVLVLKIHPKKQLPSAKAPVFMQDLPYRWNIGRYILRPWKIEKRFTSKPPLKHQCFRPPQSHWSMIALVKSWVVNRPIREAIRRTWGLVNTVDSVEIHVVFLLAKAASDRQKIEIENENNKFGDILQIDAAEQLKFFTVRSVAGMAWVSRRFPSDFIYSSLDDNMLPFLHKLIPMIDPFVKQAPTAEDECSSKFIFPILCGFSFRIHDRPSRDPKTPWSMTRDLYPPEYLPPHCQGGFYTTSVSTVNSIVDVATKTYPSHIDAVWITGILRQKLGLDSESIKDLTKSPTRLVQYLEIDIAKNIKAIWKSEKQLLNKHKVIYRDAQ